MDDPFFSKVDKSGSCWLWTASRDRYGYGQVRIGGKQKRAHRVAYELLVGPIPSGLQVDHLCRVRHCVNPAHMELVTSRVNTLRGQSLQAINAQKTHCKRGHEFTPANTQIYGTWRRCRACWSARRNEKRGLLPQQV